MTVSASSQPAAPAPEITQEIRIALVLYGGVSLAVYINGVVQELLRVVRATSGMTDLSGSERTYRKLGQLLSRDVVPTIHDHTDGPVRTRVRVDIISGTSAGGINGIFLAKALANEKSIDALQGLWFSEGDLAKLLNDKASYQGLGLTAPQPESLLNSRRMYSKLLDAFDGMDGTLPFAPVASSTLAERIDLYATTTDIEGIPVPIRLSDNVVYERRHRNAFHLRFLQGRRNDFERLNNPFLAFAARCTSSFPFAFEPMRLCDIDEVLNRNRDWAQRPYCMADGSRWQKFFTNYLAGVSKLSTKFPQRSFGDGGYLNNAPFSFAVDALLTRESEVPVERKLIYVEPSPAHPESAPNQPKPNAIENSLAALITVPGYQTIRQDLDRALQRNVAVTRINRTIREIEAEIQNDTTNCPAPAEGSDIAFNADTCFDAYYRMRASEVTDLLAQMVARRRWIEEESAHFRALRALIRAWRQQMYGVGQEGLDTARFLRDFDLPYRLRRLRFVMRKLDDLRGLKSDDPVIRSSAEAIVRFGSGAGEFDDDAQVPSVRRRFAMANKALREIYDQVLGIPDPDRTADPNDQRSTPADLRLKVEDDAAAAVDGILPTRDEILWALDQIVGMGNAGAPPELTPQAETKAPRYDAAIETRHLGKKGGDLRQPDDIYRERAEARMKDGRISERLNLAAEALKAVLKTALDKAHAAAVGVASGGAADRIARRYYECFDIFDAIQYPMMFGTSVGEADVVDIIRICPEDCTALIDNPEARKTKLKGLIAAHFGAFLNEDWRVSDLLWGRLDAAERIISALLPWQESEALKNRLIDEAHREILIEFDAKDRLMQMAVRQATGHAPSGQAAADARAFVALLPDQPQDRAENARFMTYWQATVPADPDPVATVGSVARATTITGKILDKIGDDNSIWLPSTWLVRVGRLLWGLVEVSAPRSIGSLFGRYWQQLGMVVAIVLIVFGVLKGSSEVATAGWTVFGFVTAFFVARTVLGTFMRGGSVKRLVAGALITILAALLLIGVWTVRNWVVAGLDRVESWSQYVRAVLRS